MEDQYIRGRAFELESQASDVIDEVKKEYGDVQIHTSNSGDGQTGQQDVDLPSPEESILESFSPDEALEKESDTSLTYVQSRGFSREDPEAMWTEAHERFVRSEEVKEKLEKVREVNQAMKESGRNRRYVMSPSESPEDAYVHKDDFSYFFFKTEETFRPSDVVAKAGDDSWWLYDDNERVLKTIAVLSDAYSDAVQHLNEVEKAYTFTDRVLKTEDEVVRDEDVFTLKQQDAVVSTIVQALGDSPFEKSLSREEQDLLRRILNLIDAIEQAKDEIVDALPDHMGEFKVNTVIEELEDASEALQNPEDWGGMVGDADDIVSLSLAQASSEFSTLQYTIDDRDAGSDSLNNAIEEIESNLEQVFRDVDQVLDVDI